MHKPSEKLEIVSPKTIRDIPEIAPGEIFLAPRTPHLYDPICTPINNYRTWPEWWKEIPSKEGSLRRCAGTADYLSLGVTLPLWAKLKLRPSPNKRFWESRFDIGSFDEPFAVEAFGYEQTGQCPITKVRKIEKANYVKILSPWVIKTAPGWSCMFVPPAYEPDPRYTLLPAVVNTDYYHHAHIVLNILTDEEFEIDMGTPMQHIIPFKRENGLEIKWGDENAFNLLDQKGFGTVFTPINMKSRYKKTQREEDVKVKEFEDSNIELASSSKQNIFCRFFRWLLRK